MTIWNQLTNLNLQEIVEWAEEQLWAQAMATCLQDTEWHAEGDVWTHTKMVCHELEKLSEWHNLSHREQLALIFTALFHDSGKPVTTIIDPDTGRTRSPKHSVKGEFIVRQVLRELECDLLLREEIARLVRYHGRPPFLFDKDDPAKELISLSWYVNHKLLYLFALADTRGRQSEEMTRPEENLHYWKVIAEENGCFEQPYKFENDQARFLFYRDELSSLHYVPHEDFRCTVTMMSGLPGSGKDTWLLNHHQELPVVSLDDVRQEMGVIATDNQGQVIQSAKLRCREYLRQETSFAFNATNLIKQTRSGWIELFHSYHARVKIVYLEPPLKDIFKQNKTRDRVVPENVIRTLADKVEPPTWAEGHRVEYCGNDG